MSSNSPDNRKFTLDSYLPSPWRDEQITQLERWRQGHLIARPGLTWISPVDDDPITGLPGLEEAAVETQWDAALLPEIDIHYGIISSQTCDVGAEGPGRRHAFVQVSPVVNLDEWANDRQDSVRKHEIVHLVALTSLGLDPGFWVADLRISVPMSKAFLLTREPIPAFGSYRDELAFADQLAYRLRRPALHKTLSEDVPKSLNEFIKSKQRSSKDHEWLDNVTQIRLLMSEDPLRESQVTLILIGREDFAASSRAAWRMWFEQNRRKFPGFRVCPLMFSTMHRLSAHYYSSSVPIRIDALGRPPAW